MTTSNGNFQVHPHALGTGWQTNYFGIFLEKVSCFKKIFLCCSMSHTFQFWSNHILALKRKVLSNLHLKLKSYSQMIEWKLSLFIENLSKGIHYLKNAFVLWKYPKTLCQFWCQVLMSFECKICRNKRTKNILKINRQHWVSTIVIF